MQSYMKSVKTAPVKETANDKLRRLIGFSYEGERVARAYADCNDIFDEKERNLNFITGEPVNGAQLLEIMSGLVPEYNGFKAERECKALIAVFGVDAQYFIARESSVCIYVRPLKGNVWLGGGRNSLENIRADEMMFCPSKQMFRFWWD